MKELRPANGATGSSLPTNRSHEDWARSIASGVLGLSVADTLFL